MNKKGDAGDWANFAGFFLILILIGGGITAGYFTFFKGEYGFKETEARLILSEVEKCLYEKGIGDFNLTKCGLSESVLSDRRLVYINSSEGEFFVGVLDYRIRCHLIDEKDVFPKCVEKEILLNGDKVHIITASNAGVRSVVK